MKHWAGFLTGGLVVAASALFLAGCYTQMSASRGDDDEGYAQESQAPDQSQADTTSDYESARDRFYSDNYYGSDYPAYSVGIGFGWYSPWYGYGYPWYYYDGWPYSRWYSPYGYYSPAYYGFSGWPGYYGYYGGHGYYGGYYGRPSATRRFGMIRSSGGSRGAYGTGAGPTTVMPSGSRSAVGATRTSTPGVRSRGAVRYGSRPQRGVYARPAQSGTSSGRSQGRTYSGGGSRGSAPASTGGGGGRGGGGGSRGGGGGSRGGSGGGGSHGGGGGGGSHGGGGRR